MAHTCRGTISLHGAVIHTENQSANFIVSNGGGTQVGSESDGELLYLCIIPDIPPSSYKRGGETEVAHCIGAGQGEGSSGETCCTSEKTENKVRCPHKMMKLSCLKLVFSFKKHPKRAKPKRFSLTFLSCQCVKVMWSDF